MIKGPKPKTDVRWKLHWNKYTGRQNVQIHHAVANPRSRSQFWKLYFYVGVRLKEQDSVKLGGIHMHAAVIVFVIVEWRSP